MQNRLDSNAIYLLGFYEGNRKAVEIEETNLLKANINLSDENRLLKQENQELKEIRNNALEYIEKYKGYNVIPLELYEILKGGKDE